MTAELVAEGLELVNQVLALSGHKSPSWEVLLRTRPVRTEIVVPNLLTLVICRGMKSRVHASKDA